MEAFDALPEDMRPLIHRARPVGAGGKGLAGVYPCLVCRVGTSVCACDVVRNEERLERRNEGKRGVAVPSPLPPSFMWEDGTARERGLVKVYLNLPGDELPPRSAISSSFSSRSFRVSVSLPAPGEETGEKETAIGIPRLYAKIRKDQCRATCRRVGGRSSLVVTLQKEDEAMPWPALGAGGTGSLPSTPSLPRPPFPGTSGRLR